MSNLPAHQCSNHTFAFLVPLSSKEPARGLGKEPQGNDDEQAKNTLESNWKPPGEIRGSVRGTKIHPVGDQCANRNRAALDTNQETPVGRPRTFGLVRRYGGCIHAVADASDDSPNAELSQRNVTGVRSDLENDSQNHDCGTEHDGPASTKPVTKC